MFQLHDVMNQGYIHLGVNNCPILLRCSDVMRMADRLDLNLTCHSSNEIHGAPVTSKRFSTLSSFIETQIHRIYISPLNNFKNLNNSLNIELFILLDINDTICANLLE